MRAVRIPAALLVVAAVAVVACQDWSTAPDELDTWAPEFARGRGSGRAVADAPIFADFSQIDEQLAAAGLDGRLGMVEYVTINDAGEFGRTVIVSNRGNKQLASHWVLGDTRRFSTTDIKWIVDLFDGATSSGLSAAQTDAAINGAMATWNATTCSTIPLTNLGSFNFDLGVIQAIFGLGGILAVFADVTHAGWVPGAFFNTAPFFPPNGQDFILGVTFTFFFFPFTDINNDGKIDVAFREIYYNDNFGDEGGTRPGNPWGINANPPSIDVETVALHEAGHGLSQAHFGDIFLDAAGRRVHFAPFAVMNAAISRQAQTLEGTDVGGHCSIWGNWPNKPNKPNK